MTIEEITIDLAGEISRASDRLTFGREADIVVDDANQYMHRVVGGFEPRNGQWWITNNGSTSRLVVFGMNGIRVELPAGTETVLSSTVGAVNFTAGPTPYELAYFIGGQKPGQPGPAHDRPLGTQTLRWGPALTARETDFMVVFARTRLEGTTGRAATYDDVAGVWGVSPKTVDNTLQGLRRKLTEEGVRGVETVDGLVDHLLSHGKLGLRHLMWARLDESDGPVTAADAPRR